MDKIDTCHRFKSGNTRLKDFDDLYRFATIEPSFDKNLINNFIKQNKIHKIVDEQWISKEMSDAWKLYAKRYPTLPSNIEDVFKTINSDLL